MASDTDGARASARENASPPWTDRAVVIVGFMGSGKSSVGRDLAPRIGRTFHDVDAVIEDELGATIPELFAAGREMEFRDAEERVIARLVAERPPAVLALGGGALERAATAALVERTAVVVHLELDPADLERELDELRPGRPLLAGRGAAEILDLQRRREPAYARAHISVAPDRRGPTAVVEAVLARLGADGGTGGARD